MGKLRLIPEIVASALQEKDLLITPDKDAFDYIYEVPYLANLHLVAGYQSHSARLLRLFLQTYPDYMNTCCALTEASHPDLRELYERWAKAKNIDHAITNEYRAFERLLQCECDHVFSLHIYIQGQLQAFGFFEILPQRYAMGHFCKAVISYKGIYEAITWHMAKFLLEKGVQYYNIEQDLGIPNLRLSKAKYPHSFLKKYVVELPEPP